MLIDTHCHLDAPEFDIDRTAVAARAVAAGVSGWVIPSVARAQFDAVKRLAHAVHGDIGTGGDIGVGVYALGIHPLFVPQSTEEDLQALEHAVADALADPRFVGMGEIGLDFFVPELCTPAMRARQENFYAAQLALAQRHGLPVILHVRRSHDVVLKHLRQQHRQTGVLMGGIAHAFNGSTVQAKQFVDLGVALGVGGAMTYPRALQIRRHAAYFGLDHLVLETDAPDIPPAWLHPPHRRNTPAQVAGIARELATLRGQAMATVIAATGATALRVLPRLVGALADTV